MPRPKKTSFITHRFTSQIPTICVAETIYNFCIFICLLQGIDRNTINFHYNFTLVTVKLTFISLSNIISSNAQDKTCNIETKWRIISK